MHSWSESHEIFRDVYNKVVVRKALNSKMKSLNRALLLSLQQRHYIKKYTDNY